MPRLLLNELSLMLELTRERPIDRTSLRAGAELDPVCGMAIEPDSAAPEASYVGITYSFCSGACHGRFMADPQRYLAPRPTPDPLRQ